MKTLLIIPAYNESQVIAKLINEIELLCPDVDYLIVNDCSTDNTVEIMKQIGASYVSAPINLGIGGAVKTGYMYARDNGYDIAIQVDGDGQHDVRFVHEMIKYIEDDECDIVIGSRFIKKDGFQSTRTRRVGIRFLSRLIWLTSGAKVKDVTSGFRAVNRFYIELFANAYPDDYPEPEVIVTSKIYGARIKEIPVEMRERVAGKSSINLKKSIYYMIKVSMAILVCRMQLGIRRYKGKE